MASTKVIIVGAGIAGPVLGMLLKMRGYNPIVYERLPAFSTAGLSLVYVFSFYIHCHYTSPQTDPFDLLVLLYV